MPATRRCCIVGCQSNSRFNPNLQFFQFPRPDNPYHQRWIEACHASMSHILPFKKPVMCALHFMSHHIGGRRLTSNAVPTLKLDVPSNLKDVENQAMFDEIERSRKFAYINAVVYEWLVRANMNPQLRGSITHGMIKEKAETAKKIIACESFVADNRWLNRFRETHLTNFAKKLSTNQLKPMGPSLWIPDIVHDLEHSFPPAKVERMENLVNVPEHYINYMKQYGDYEEDDETDQDQSTGGGQDEQQDDSLQETKMAAQTYFKNYQAGQTFYQQVQHQYDQNGYSGDYNTYEDYYQDRDQKEKINTSNKQQNSRPPSHASAQNRSSPYTPVATTHNSSKRRVSTEDAENNMPEYKRTASDDKDSRSQSISPTSDVNDNNNHHVPEKSFKIKLPSLLNINNSSNNNNNTRSSISPTSNSQVSRSNSPKSEIEPTNTPATTTNGRTTTPTPSLDTNARELDSYAQAIDYLKPLEDFALFAENFRAIGLLSQLEAVLRKGAVLSEKKQA